jgi:hypothetical protein
MYRSVVTDLRGYANIDCTICTRTALYETGIILLLKYYILFNGHNAQKWNYILHIIK